MTVHVIGAGMAGLAASLRLARAGKRVVLHEQTRIGGGRCMAFRDTAFSQTLDNGIHLYFAGQRHLHAFLADIGLPRTLVGSARAACQFIDIENGHRWTLHPTIGTMPVWLLAPWRAVPGIRASDFLHLLTLARAGPSQTVAQIMPRKGLGRRYFWEPLCVAALNTEPAAASAQALWQMVRNVLTSGEVSLRPQFVKTDLATDLVDPALRRFLALNGEVRFGSPLRGIEFSGHRATDLHFANASQPIDTGDRVVLAVPASAAGKLLPRMSYPMSKRAVVTAHFALTPAEPMEPVLTAIIETRPLWLLTRGGIATVTIGAADDLVDIPRSQLARRLWAPVAKTLRRDPAVLPDWHVLKFRDSTHAHTPAEEARRPATKTCWHNLVLAGDWTRTGQSATVDGAIQSGYAAADALLRGR